MKTPKVRAATFWTGAIGAFIGACSAGPAPMSQSPRDPTSPNAPEGQNPLMAYAAASKHEAPGAPSEASPLPEAEGVTYVCPMHPEVTSKAPGTCPQCGMRLVPKK